MKRNTSHAYIGLMVLMFSVITNEQSVHAAGSNRFSDMVVQSKVLVDRVEAADYTQVDISSVRIVNSNANGDLRVIEKVEVGTVTVKDGATVKVAAFNIQDTELDNAASISLSAKVNGNLRVGNASKVSIGSFSTGPNGISLKYSPVGINPEKYDFVDTGFIDPEHLTYAHLYNCINDSECIFPDGWEKVSLDDLGINSIKFADWAHWIDGLGYTIYYNSSLNRYVLAFHGTNFKDPRDVLTDLSQGLGLPTPQYIRGEWIAEILTEFVNEMGAELVFIGHSLGGGLASAASLHTGKKAVTFNAAGLNQLTTLFPKGDPEKLITAYYIKGEALSSLQDSKFGDIMATEIKVAMMLPNLSFDDFPDAVGKRIPLESPSEYLGPIKRHNIKTVIDAMEKINRGDG